MSKRLVDPYLPSPSVTSMSDDDSVFTDVDIDYLEYLGECYKDHIRDLRQIEELQKKNVDKYTNTHKCTNENIPVAMEVSEKDDVSRDIQNAYGDGRIDEPLLDVAERLLACRKHIIVSMDAMLRTWLDSVGKPIMTPKSEPPSSSRT